MNLTFKTKIIISVGLGITCLLLIFVPSFFMNTTEEKSDISIEKEEGNILSEGNKEENVGIIDPNSLIEGRIKQVSNELLSIEIGTRDMTQLEDNGEVSEGGAVEITPPPLELTGETKDIKLSPSVKIQKMSNNLSIDSLKKGMIVSIQLNNNGGADHIWVLENE